MTRIVRVLLAIAGVAALLLMATANRESWDVDFNQYYTAGSLVGSGHLYDWPLLQTLELRRTHTAVPFIRLPFFALPFRFLSMLPWTSARIVFLALELA